MGASIIVLPTVTFKHKHNVVHWNEPQLSNRCVRSRAWRYCSRYGLPYDNYTGQDLTLFVKTFASVMKRFTRLRTRPRQYYLLRDDGQPFNLYLELKGIRTRTYYKWKYRYVRAWQRKNKTQSILQIKRLIIRVWNVLNGIPLTQKITWCVPTVTLKSLFNQDRLHQRTSPAGQMVIRMDNI